MSLTQINKAGLDEIALDHVFTIGASGSSAYTFQGEGLNGTVNNPTLYLTRGKTYRFENGSGGHPIRIQSTSGASGTAYNTGVTNNAGSGTVIVEVQHDAPDVLYYQCTSHAAMNGILYITGALADGGVTTAKIAAGAVTEAKLATNAVTTDKINSGVITNAKLAANAVGTANIADEAVTLAKLPHGTSSNDGKFLRANNGADPSFETVTSTTINNNADNRVITGSGTANTLNGEANLSFNGNSLVVTDSNGTTTVGGNYALLKRTSGTTNYIAAPNADAVLDISADEIIRFGTVNTADFNSTERMRIDSSGNLALGGFAPPTDLNSAITPSLFIDSNQNSISAESGGLYVTQNAYFNSGGSYEYVNAAAASQYRQYAGVHSFLGAASGSAGANFSFTEHVRLDTNGQLLVGTTQSSVYGNRQFAVGDVSDSSSFVEIRTSNTGTGHLLFSQTAAANSGNYRGYIAYNQSSDAMSFHTGGGTQRVRIDNDGLKFNSDTAAANALDDYEEGTFNATCSNSVTLHANSNACSYTKIGRQVTVRGQIRINDGNSNSYLVINNLPFTNVDTEEDSDMSIGAVRMWDLDVSATTLNVICLINGASTDLGFWRNRDNASGAQLNAKDGAYLAFTITYFTS